MSTSTRRLTPQQRVFTFRSFTGFDGNLTMVLTSRLFVLLAAFAVWSALTVFLASAPATAHLGHHINSATSRAAAAVLPTDAVADAGDCEIAFLQSKARQISVSDNASHHGQHPSHGNGSFSCCGAACHGAAVEVGIFSLAGSFDGPHFDVSIDDRYRRSILFGLKRPPRSSLRTSCALWRPDRQR